MRQAAGEGFSTATDLADWLARTLKMPFREAHRATGQIVAKAAEAGVWRSKNCRSPPCRRSNRGSPRRYSACSRSEFGEQPRIFGGTAPKNVRAQAKSWLKRLQKQP